ncbi:MAG: hypothetical protein HRT89_08775, partial [Lentisphaeria bacterium]|nr:hypothetical protein [Lentisphaeria bacterium]
MNVHIAIPVLAEMESLPNLLAAMDAQTLDNFEVWICVNQPEDYHEDMLYADIVKQNEVVLEFLETRGGENYHILDHASHGMGWKNKKHSGVGWARKVIMDAICRVADIDDIIISMDADTVFNPGYFASVKANLKGHPNAVGLVIPYEHHLSGDTAIDRAALRYELYMRYYNCQQWRIGSKYNFTAFGSALAIRVADYSAVGGISPKQAGEDFYLLQKLRKYGPLLLWNEEKVYPMARESFRIPFGTGPAITKGLANDWSSYPFYSQESFDQIRDSIALYPKLYEHDVDTPMTEFLKSIFHTDDLWSDMRKNFKTQTDFVRSCHTRIDGLRQVQFLKSQNTSPNDTALFDYL